MSQINIHINLNNNSPNEFTFDQFYDSVKELSNLNYANANKKTDLNTIKK